MSRKKEAFGYLNLTLITAIVATFIFLSFLYL